MREKRLITDSEKANHWKRNAVTLKTTTQKQNY